MSKKPYYITTAIAYTSGKPHIGNTYEIVLADAIARFKRKEGYDVRFQTGTDEHGQKIELKAEEAGITPKEFVDNVSGEIKRIWDLMNTSYDKFIRTTDEDHEKQVKKIFKKMYAKGDIYKGHYEGMYCTPCESFFTESQLVDGKCPDCGRPCVPAKEEAYFFKMSKYADKLIDYINTHPDFIQPESRKNEMMNNFLLPGLQDLCVSRTSFKWGIPVDFDPKHVVYVWLDALTNYITGIGYDCDGESSESQTTSVTSFPRQSSASSFIFPLPRNVRTSGFSFDCTRRMTARPPAVSSSLSSSSSEAFTSSSGLSYVIMPTVAARSVSILPVISIVITSFGQKKDSKTAFAVFLSHVQHRFFRITFRKPEDAS